MPTVVVTITTPDCTCCTPCVNGTLSCRTRGGTATLCGYSEYTSPSSPPKKYRRRDLVGEWQSLDYGVGDTACAVFFRFGACEKWSGFCQYDSATCALTTSGTYQKAPPHEGSSCGAYTSFSACTVGGPYINGHDSLVETQTTYELYNDGNCIGINPDTGRGWKRVVIALPKETLSVEDTEADAITRLLAGSGGTWSSWSAGSPTTCLARYEQRTTGFSFVHQDAQWRITASGLTPGASYVVAMDFYRSVFGAGSYTLYQSITAMGTADGSGNLDIEGDVPNDVGYDTYAQQGTCQS